MQATRQAHAVVVGGGIAGTALAIALAKQNKRVLVLERETVYRDRGMGEYIQPWGVEALQSVGLLETLVAAGAALGTEFLAFEGHDGAEHVGHVKKKALDAVLPNVPGSLQIDHARVNEALTKAAESMGATVLRGAKIRAIRTGTPATVDYVHNGLERTVQTNLVVGADGRRSAVRTSLGSDLRTRPIGISCDSFLVDHVSGWPVNRNALGNDHAAHFILLGRTDGRGRLYRFRDATRAKPARASADELLAVARRAAWPWGNWLTDARPVSPVIRHHLTEADCSAITGPGTILIGDAAGWSNPLIGQGLSIVFHDVLRIAELVDSGLTQTAKAEYHAERRRLLERLRLSAWLATSLQCDFGVGAANRRQDFAERAQVEPLLDVPLSSYVSGPLRADAEAFSPTNKRRIHEVLGTSRAASSNQYTKLY